MGEQTSIEWATATWNPWVGCRRVSPGCAHCYMMRDVARFGQDPEAIRLTSAHTFNGPTRWKAGQRIFTCSWSDFFHEQADEWRPRAWALMRATPQHTYMVLTKRSARFAECLPRDWDPTGRDRHIWLGVSVENQRWLHRALDLATVPAAVRFLSCEPLLGPLAFGVTTRPTNVLEAIDWVIVGGESGAGARPMELDWARGVRDECRRAGAAFYLKQLGGWPNKRGGSAAVLDGRLHRELPLDVGKRIV